MDVLPYIQRHPAFAGLDADGLAEVAKLWTTQSYRTGDLIFEQGTSDSGLCIVLSGRVALKGLLSSGEMFTLEEVREDSIFGEVSCFSDGVRSAQAVATADTVVMYASRDQVTTLLQLHPGIAEVLLTLMASRLQRLSHQMRSSLPTVRSTLESKATPLDRFTDRVVHVLGQYWVIGIQVSLVALGMVLSINGAMKAGTDIATDANLWGLFLGSLGLMTAALVLASERRQREDAKRRDEIWDQWRVRLDHEVERLTTLLSSKDDSE